MSGMAWLFSIYIEALQKAFGLDRHEAYVFAGKRAKGFVDGCLIKNDDAHAVVEAMEMYGKEGAIDFSAELRGEL
jgi:hypothetical protein